VLGLAVCWRPISWVTSSMHFSMQTHFFWAADHPGIGTNPPCCRMSTACQLTLPHATKA
jgi:hypothetical protein